MSSEAVELTYFHGWGLAEQTRWLLAASGVEWKQVNLDTHEEFLALRDGGELMFGQLPLLRIDGRRLVQSQATVRYLARRAGLDGDSEDDRVLMDMVAEACRDCRGAFLALPFAADKQAHCETLPAHFEKFFPRFEAVLARGKAGEQTDGEGSSSSSSSSSSFFPGILPSGSMCYADVLMAEAAHGLDLLSPGCLDPFPLLKRCTGAVLALPSVAKYLSSDKRFPFPSGDVGQRYVDNVQTVLGRK